MIRLGVLIGFCAAVISAGNEGNTTKSVEEQETKDNVAEASDFGGNLFDLGSVSSGLLSHGMNFQSGFTPILAPTSNTESHHEGDENVKTITLTKNVPVPYTVTVEKRVPVRVEVPVDKPYPVYVPRPYQVVVEKKVPYEVKVPVPQPYTVEKHVPVPVTVHVARPYPVHIPAPYPVFMVRKVPYTIEKHIPFPVKVPVVRPYPVHIPVEKRVPYPVEKTVPYPVHVHVERPVPVPVEKPYPVHVEKHVPVPVEKLIPVPVKIPVGIPIPIPMMSHHAGVPSNNEYYQYIHEQSEQNQQQEYQYQHQGEETKEHENMIGQSGTLLHHEIPVGVQQQQYHYEGMPAYQQPSQAYGTYGEPQQQGHALYTSHESKVATGNSSYESPVEQHGHSNHLQDVGTYRNDVSKNEQQFLSIEDYSKAIREQYDKQRHAEHAVGNEAHKDHQGANDEYEALRAQSDSGERKQQSYFKVNMGSSAYTSSVHHGLKTTG